MEHRLRFWRWFRTIPLMTVLLLGALSYALVVAPGSVSRSLLFPISHKEAILESSARHNVDPLLVCAIIKCESGWNSGAQSSVGAVGLMQVMPETAETLASAGYVDSWSFSPAALSDPTINIEYGCACLEYLHDSLSSTDEVIAAYNAGLGSVQSWMSGDVASVSEVIAYPETRYYLARVNEVYDAYAKLYDEELSER